MLPLSPRPEHYMFLLAVSKDSHAGFPPPGYAYNEYVIESGALILTNNLFTLLCAYYLLKVVRESLILADGERRSLPQTCLSSREPDRRSNRRRLLHLCRGLQRLQRSQRRNW
jgi:hypothetical protein